MAGIVFLTLDAGGNVPPALAIARELLSRGHRVRILAPAGLAERLSADGFDATDYRRGRGWSPAVPTSALRGALSFAAVLADRGYAADLADALRAEPADVVVIDGLLAGTALDAARLGSPVVVLVHSFAEFFLRNPAIRSLTAALGVPMRRAWAGAAAVVVVADRDLDPAGRRSVPGNLVWTGVAEEAVAGSVEEGVGAPRVLVSFSTVAVAGQARRMQRVLDAVAPLPISVIVTTGPAVDPAELRPGGNTTVLRAAPHAELLPTCSAVIGHGGHSTTMRALMHGLPLVIIPADARIDQPLVASAVERAGAGLRLPRSASTGRIRDALRTVLSEPAYRAAARRIGERLRRQHGTARAADVVLEIAARRPVSHP